MTNVMAFNETKTPAGGAMYLADKEIMYCDILKKRGSGFYSYIRYNLFKNRGVVNVCDAEEIYQRMCVRVWEKVYSDDFECTADNIIRTFIGAAKFLCKKSLWSVASTPKNFSDLDFEEGQLFSDTLALDVNDEEQNDFYLKYDFLQSAIRELSIVEQSFITCYLKNDCSLIKTIHELGEKPWIAQTQIKVIFATIKAKIKDPALLELIQDGYQSKRAGNASLSPTLSATRYDIALEAGWNIISRNISKWTAKNYRLAYTTFVKTVEQLFGDTRYTLNDFTAGCFRAIMEHVAGRASERRYLIFCQQIRHICNALVEKGYIQENLFWLTYKDRHSIETKDREKTDEKVNLIREWARQGLSKDEIFSSARVTWPGIHNSTVNLGLKLAMAGGDAKKDMRPKLDIKLERVSIVLGWLKDPNFKVSYNELTNFTADYFKSGMASAWGYVKAAREAMGMDSNYHRENGRARIKRIIEIAGDFSMTHAELNKIVSVELGLSLGSAHLWVSRAEKAAGKTCKKRLEVVKAVRLAKEKEKPVKVLRTPGQTDAERTAFIIATYPEFDISHSDLVKVLMDKFQITRSWAQKSVHKAELAQGRNFIRLVKVAKESNISVVAKMLKEPYRKIGEVKDRVAAALNVSRSCAEKYIYMAMKKTEVA